MQQAIKRSGQFLVVLLTVLCLLPHNANGSPDQAQQLYQKAWQIIKDNYYDTSFNTQDWQGWQHRYAGKIVTTESRHGCTTDSCRGGVLTNQPIVLLCDHDSASASEILAGALKDNGRAILVGTKTYGKGLVQEITRLPDGSGMHVTVARYFTPKGTDINKIGISPDIKVEGRDSQLAQAVESLKQQIAQHAVPSPDTAWFRKFGLGPRLLSPRG